MSKVSPVGIAVTALASLTLAASCGLQVKYYPDEEPGSGGSPVGSGSGGTTVGSGGTTVGSGSGGSNGSGGNSQSTGSGGQTGGDGGMPTTGSGGAGMGGVSGIMVNIGGTMVPKEKAIAFIHFGHSNMAGRGQAPASLKPYFLTDVDPHAWMYHASGNKKGFLPANEPFTAGDATSLQENDGGPGTPLVKQAAAMAPGYEFISVGFGQNALFCRNYAPGGTYYKAAMAGPMALKGQVTFAAIVIMLGITERHGTATDIQNYPMCINSIVTQIRTDLGLPNLPLMITDYEMTANTSAGEDLTYNGPFGSQILPRIHTIPSFISKLHPITYMPPTGMNPAVMNSALVPTDKLALRDDHHFQLDSHKTWTQNLLDIMKEAGWFPWAAQ
ncbi:MAG TPA: sialate O-acetylesterase [Polyangia bacterium]|jgi:hypothetical protein|nr:sialate O-acetylesterase [Polyangia bacterium]